MFPFKKKERPPEVSAATVTASVIAVVALCIALGAARWSWYAIQDLVLLRQDFDELRSQQDQLKIQFDFWDQRVSQERASIKKMRDDMMRAASAPAAPATAPKKR